MIKSKGILTISIISLFAVESAYAAIASSGYVDQQVETRISEVVEAGDGNVVSSISTERTKVTANKDIDAEVTDNKVTEIRTVDAATDTAYPSEKAVATALDAKQDKLEGEVLTNTATGSNSVSTGGANVTTGGSSLAIGVDAATGSSGEVAVGAAATSGGYSSVAVGNVADATGGNAVAVGQNSLADSMNSTAVGQGAKSTATYAIQLGAGTNTEANTFSVGLSNSNNYKLLGSDGKIPAERLPFEGDVLTNTSTLSSSFSTANANPATSAYAVAIGDEASTYTAGTAVGYQTYTETYEGTAVGYQAKAPGYRTVSLGSNANSTDEGASSIGAWSAASGYSSTGLGYYAKAQADYAIQLGYGTNSEAKTLSVGFGTTSNYKLLGSDGKIPAERLPFTGDVLTNTATGSNSFSTGDANAASADRAVAIGSTASAGNSSIALGYGADASASTGVAIGVGSTAEGGSTAVGAVSRTSAENSVAIGFGSAASATRAIQIGQGTNSEANTLSVGLDGTNNYKLLGSDGKIPAERLPVARIPVGSETATSYASIWVE